MTRSVGNASAFAPRVSVVMACYNASATVRQAIESVQLQTLSDWELIVVDDGSLDGSVEIVASLASSDSRIRQIRQENAGPSMARNRGVDETKADIIAFLDADDLWTPAHLEKHVRALEADALLGISFGHCRFMDEQGRPTARAATVRADDIRIADVMLGNPTTTCSALVIRHAVFDSAGKMRTDMVHAEDQEWLFRVIHAGWRIRGQAQSSVWYRIGTGSLSAQTDKMLAGWLAFLEHARSVAPSTVAEHERAARASMELYAARRKLDGGGRYLDVANHVLRAITGHPPIVLKRLQSVARSRLFDRLGLRQLHHQPDSAR